MLNKLQIYFVPGLVIQSVIVGATYATGREVTEFFLKFGPASALVGLLISTVMYSLVCTVAFELARRYQVLDYKRFCKVYLGPFWILYEIGFLFGVMLTLSVIAAASGEIVTDMTGLPNLWGAIGVMVPIAVLVSIGGRPLEKVMSIWSIYFYAAYLALVVLTLMKFGGQFEDKLAMHDVDSSALSSAAIYTAFSSAVLPTLVFVARYFRTSSDAVVAGLLSGPLVILPGLALVIMLTPFFPEVIAEPIPISLVFANVGNDALVIAVQIAMLGTFTLTGAGLLHGINERVANARVEKQQQTPLYVRAGLAVAAMVFSVFLAARFGIVDLVAKGFRIGAFAFIVVIFLPLLTRGIWLILPRKRAVAVVADPGPEQERKPA